MEESLRAMCAPYVYSGMYSLLNIPELNKQRSKSHVERGRTVWFPPRMGSGVLGEDSRCLQRPIGLIGGSRDLLITLQNTAWSSKPGFLQMRRKRRANRGILDDLLGRSERELLEEREGRRDVTKTKTAQEGAAISRNILR
jgi:hypothetical protein